MQGVSQCFNDSYMLLLLFFYVVSSTYFRLFFMTFNLSFFSTFYYISNRDIIKMLALLNFLI